MKRSSLFILTVVFLTGVAALFDCALAEEPSKKVPVTVNADKLDYDRGNDMYVAVGHVRVEQEGSKIQADRIVLNNKTGEALAEGNVYLQEKGDVVRADKLQININTKAGFIYNGDLFMQKDNLHLRGEKIERKSENVYHIENGTFTTCDEGDWYLKADEIDVDMDRYATGTGVSFNMSGIPVFYTPYFLFPVRRQSGLLIPEFGYSSSEGFLLKNSLFWAISDSKDMTYYSDYRARHGLGNGLEYRYVNSRDSMGLLYYNYFSTFDQYRSPQKPDARWLLSYRHSEEMAEDLSVRADINLVSDFEYFTDLERKLELRSKPYIDSNLFYVERWDTASLYLIGQYAIDLYADTNENTVQKMPELRYNIFEERIAGPVHVNFDGSATNLTVEKGDNLMRADFNPRISAAFGRSGLTLTPRLGARTTFYGRSEDSSEPTQRRYYYAGADLNARLSRIYGNDVEAGVGRIRHSIEPAVSYSYIPRVEQTNIPQVWPDAVAEQNLVTASVINRLTARYKDAAGFRSFDLVVFRLSQSYDLKQAREEETALRPRSEVRGELFVKTPKMLTLSSIHNYDTYADAFTSSSESVNVNGDTARFNLTRQYLHTPRTRFLIAGAGTKIGNWDVDGQFWRDVVENKTTQQEYKLHYGSQCWGLGVMYVTKPGETQFMMTLELKGLGALKF